MCSLRRRRARRQMQAGTLYTARKTRLRSPQGQQQQTAAQSAAAPPQNSAAEDPPRRSKGRLRLSVGREIRAFKCTAAFISKDQIRTVKSNY